MQFRHEWKHEISTADFFALRSRLAAVMLPDNHAADGKYEIRSLYFDDLRDTALREKIDGVNRREKFRLRFYNGDPDYIVLEKKSKINGLCRKEQQRVSSEEVEMILNRNFDVWKASPFPLIKELYIKMQTKGLQPKTIVDYTREPFVYAPGNVRVTLDYNIRTGLLSTDFLNPHCVTVPSRDAPIILEVKWDSYLPSMICDIVQLQNCRSTAFSKYAACRIYG